MIKPPEDRASALDRAARAAEGRVRAAYRHVELYGRRAAHLEKAAADARREERAAQRRLRLAVAALADVRSGELPAKRDPLGWLDDPWPDERRGEK